MSVDAILKEVAALPEAERAELIGRLIDRYDPEPTEELSDAMKAFIDDRLAKYRANPQNTKSWEEVHAAALARAKK
jgi:putative addiction module component (TIGR02574 family)